MGKLVQRVAKVSEVVAEKLGDIRDSVDTALRLFTQVSAPS